jgi:hypothetical protein
MLLSQDVATLTSPWSPVQVYKRTLMDFLSNVRSRESDIPGAPRADPFAAAHAGAVEQPSE